MYSRYSDAFKTWIEKTGLNPNNLIELSDLHQLREMRERIMSIPELRQLIRGAEAEVSGFTVLNGVPCKYRCDLRKETKKYNLIIDWKTTSGDLDIMLNYVPNAIASYKYHLSAAFYCDQEKIINGGKPTEFCWVFQEKKAPYEVDFFFMSEQMYLTGLS